MKDRSNMIWIDLEMTGLDTQRDYIIEIASIVTDKNLNIVDEGPNLVINQPDEVLNSMDQWNTNHHNNSGLTQKVRESSITESIAEKQTIEFLSKYVPKGVVGAARDDRVLAGNLCYGPFWTLWTLPIN